MPERSRNYLPGWAEKSPKTRRNTPENILQTLSGDSPDTSQTVPETFLRLLGVSQPWETFSRLFRLFGPSGPERPCKGQGGFPPLQVVSPPLQNILHIPPARPGLSGRIHERSGNALRASPEKFKTHFRVRLGSPKPYNSRLFKRPEQFQNFSPPQYGW